MKVKIKIKDIIGSIHEVRGRIKKSRDKFCNMPTQGSTRMHALPRTYNHRTTYRKHQPSYVRVKRHWPGYIGCCTPWLFWLCVFQCPQSHHKREAIKKSKCNILHETERICHRNHLASGGKFTAILQWVLQGASWHIQLKSGRTSVKDENPGRSSSSLTPETAKTIWQLVCGDHRWTTHNIAATLDVSCRTCQAVDPHTWFEQAP